MPTSGIGDGGGYVHTILPNKRSCYFGGSWPGTQAYVDVGASSYHPGGVNAMFLDGTVRFVKDSINYNSWIAIATVNPCGSTPAITAQPRASTMTAPST